MSYNCRNRTCPKCSSQHSIVKDGFFFRRCDSRKIQRYKCKNCLRKFSSATFSPAIYQKKRRFNHRLLLDFASGMSQNRAAILHKCHRKTIARKFIYLAKICRQRNEKLLKKKYEFNKATRIQFDDLITIEHTKLKPVSVTALVDKDTRIILGSQVSTIGAFGLLAEISRKKYGRRKNTHVQKMHELFTRKKKWIQEDCLFESDEHLSYPKVVRAHFPKAEHIRYPGGRGCIAGQGELKKLKHDPLFCINHTYAMFRANINRLFRRTWNTTKDIQRLQDHLDIYTYAFNRGLIL